MAPTVNIMNPALGLDRYKPTTIEKAREEARPQLPVAWSTKFMAIPVGVAGLV
jgi:hypothetical protein